MKSGFTLIELLIVIGIIGVLAAVVLVGIDPVDKIAAANDTKVQRDIHAIATAMQTYAVTHNGLYPTTNAGLGGLGLSHGPAQQELVNSGELKAVLSVPSGYSCIGGGTSYWIGESSPNNVYVGCNVKSKKYKSLGLLDSNGNTWWSWCSDSGKAEVTSGSCPP